MAQPESITVNGTTYALADLSDEAKSQIVNVQVVDAEVARLQRLIAIAQTARNAYVAALVSSVSAPKVIEQ
jgi:hypothetical protein